MSVDGIGLVECDLEMSGHALAHCVTCSVNGNAPCSVAD